LRHGSQLTARDALLEAVVRLLQTLLPLLGAGGGGALLAAPGMTGPTTTIIASSSSTGGSAGGRGDILAEPWLVAFLVRVKGPWAAAHQRALHTRWMACLLPPSVLSR